MERVNVTFKGMTNTPDDGFNSAGEMALLMNADIKNGEIVPAREDFYQKDVTGDSDSNVSKAIWHKDNLICLDDEGAFHVYYGIEKKWEHKGDLGAGMTVENFEVVGNIVIVYGLYDDGGRDVCYWIYKNDDYDSLGALPTLGDLSMTVEKQRISTATGEAFKVQAVDGDNSLWNGLHAKGYLDKCLDALYSKGCYIDQAQFRLAIKLFDGTYVWASSVYCASFFGNYDSNTDLAQGGYNNFKWTQDEKKEDGFATYVASVTGFKPNFKLPKYDFTKWEGIIDRVCLFSSGSIMIHKPKTEFAGRGEKVAVSYETYFVKSPEEVRKDMVEGVVFYKIAEYDLCGNILKSVGDTSPSNLAVQDILASVASDKIYAKKTYVYNAKLHVAEYKVIPQKLVPATSFFPVDYEDNLYGFTISRIVCRVTIKTPEGDIITVADYKNAKDSWGDTNSITPLLTYPDRRARKMQLWILQTITNSNGGQPTSTWRYKQFDLEEYGVSDMAYYLYEDYGKKPGGVNPIYKMSLDDWQETGPDSDDLMGSGQTTISNVLKVSNVDSPFYFPTAQTYKFDGDIKAMMSNAEAVSTGQFGQYPLFVFTTEGIWVMQADSTGRFAYVSQAPFSRDVCIGIGGVTPTRYGVAFVTQKGVMMISGGQVVELSQDLEGRTAEMLNDSDTKTLLGNVYNTVLSNGTLPTVYTIWDYVYDENARLGYCSGENKLVLFSSTKGYSYVYSFETKMWSICNTCYGRRAENAGVNNVLTLFMGQSMYYFANTNESSSVAKKQFLAVTRPFTLETFDFKRIRQAALRCTFKGELNFYLLGSNDGAKFSVITGKEYPAKDSQEDTTVTRRDLITAMSRSKQYKYFAIAIAGDMEGRISMAELLVEPGFAVNKLR